jgi:hypothetical protein
MVKEHEEHQWYENLAINREGFPDSERQIFAVRGTPSQFPRHLLTFRIYHLYGVHSSVHFPDCPGSTHHLWMHKRLLLPNKEETKPFIIFSIQTTLNVSPKFYESLDPHDQQRLDLAFPDLSIKQKGENEVARLIGQRLVDSYIPRIQDQWIIHRSIDLTTRHDPFPKDSLLEGKLAPRRLQEWTGQIDYYYQVIAGKFRL